MQSYSLDCVRVCVSLPMLSCFNKGVKAFFTEPLNVWHTIDIVAPATKFSVLRLVEDDETKQEEQRQKR